ncbi:hypothetical protein M0R19_03880 [Candidatus Pacearchaeota archaeon]|nr:hypothetical protein [Candidatus Pacearchaeota archaeon]
MIYQLNEGKRQIEREICREIISYLKEFNNSDKEQEMFSFEKHFSENIISISVDYIKNFNLDSDYKPFDIRANTDRNEDEEDKFVVVDIEIEYRIEYNPDNIMKFLNKLYHNLQEITAHEMEHGVTRDIDKSNHDYYNPNGTINYYRYFVDQYEVPAFVRGFYVYAKKTKQAFDEVVLDFLEEYNPEDLNDKQIKKISNIWINYAKKNNKRYPKLKLAMNENKKWKTVWKSFSFLETNIDK